VVILLAFALIAAFFVYTNRPAAATNDPAIHHSVQPAPAVRQAVQSAAGDSSSIQTAPEAAATSVAAASVEAAPETAIPIVPAAAPPSALEEVVSRVMPAVVLVETSEGRGSAFFVSPDTLVTNVHVVGRNSSVTLKRLGGAATVAMVAARSPEFDLAVLKVAAPQPNQPTIALGSAQQLRVGQDVIAIGSALGTLQNTVTRGIVSGLRRTGSALLVQTDAAVNPGNSGGPLLDRDGVAIGVTTMGYTDRQGLNFAVAADHARNVLEGRPSPPPPAGAASGLVPQLSPAVPSDAERARLEGTRAYEDALTQLARRADSLDRYWQRFREDCYQGAIVGNFDRPWFALFDGRAMQGKVPSGCSNAFSDLTREARDIREAIATAEAAAHRAGVYPGVRREGRRRVRLDHPDFDR
jgi:S1-C subfamily serine protease